MSVDPFERYPGIDGVLGLDILRDFDLDIDAPNRALTLYRVRHCEHADPPWDEPATPIAGVSTRLGWMDMPFEIDGIEETAVVDTGASNTVITPRLARRLGLTDQALANDRVVKLHVITVVARRARPPVSDNADRSDHGAQRDILILSKDPPALGGGRQFREAVIGQDFLANRRVWFSFRQVACLYHARTMTQSRGLHVGRTPSGRVALTTGH